MPVPTPPYDISECGVIQVDGTVTVMLGWTPSPDGSFQDLYGWEEGQNDDPTTAIFGSSMTNSVSSFEVPGLVKGKNYFWKIVTDGEIESDIKWFKARVESPGPPPPSGGGIPMVLILAGGAVVLLLVATRGQKIPPQVVGAALLLPP